MSRILLLIVVVLWKTWTPQQAMAPSHPAAALAAFAGAYLALVLLMGLWSRRLARHLGENDLSRDIRRFNWVMSLARMIVPAWFAVGLFVLGWGAAVDRLTDGFSSVGPIGLETPGLLVAMIPALAAWAGLWWSQYPADRALREHGLLIQLDQNLPMHAPPGFWSYCGSNLRLQVLFTMVPILLIFILRDLAMLAIRPSRFSDNLDGAVWLAAAVVVFVAAPVVLKWVLHTQPLGPSMLRQRLEAICRETGLRYRDILLWQTQHNMGNAAVMGIVPPMRYILLSDLLLETMNESQIEAVFAHEVGHVVHRHMNWYMVFFAIAMLGMFGPGQMLADRLDGLQPPEWLPMPLLVSLAGIGVIVTLFGFLSRRFERQADVFAARFMQRREPAAVLAKKIQTEAEDRRVDPSQSSWHVGQFGAAVFASALQRVAVINNIPVNARSWLHGSIANRMRYLEELSLDPTRTGRFDQFMTRLYLLLLMLLFTLGMWAVVMQWRQHPPG